MKKPHEEVLYFLWDIKKQLHKVFLFTFILKDWWRNKLRKWTRKRQRICHCTGSDPQYIQIPVPLRLLQPSGVYINTCWVVSLLFCYVTPNEDLTSQRSQLLGSQLLPQMVLSRDTRTHALWRTKISRKKILYLPSLSWNNLGTHGELRVLILVR